MNTPAPSQLTLLAHAPAALDPVAQALQRAQAQYSLFPVAHGRSAVVVGLSGGADSVCLAHALLSVAASWQLDLHLAHVDHALRASSAADAAFIAQLAEQWRLPLHTIRLEPGSLAADPDGVEAAARRQRYQFLCSVARRVALPMQTPIVAVAHHADDQAETLLLRLVRGSGVHGLAGMRPIQSMTWAGGQVDPEENDQSATHAVAGMMVNIVRPFLSLRREAILAYLRQRNLRWCEDESNSDYTFARNQVRHHVLPALAAVNPGVVEVLQRTASLLADEAARLDQMDRELLTRVTSTVSSSERIVLDAAAIAAMSHAQRRGVLRAALRTFRPTLHAVEFDHVERLAAAFDQSMPTGADHTLFGDLVWSMVAAAGKQPPQLVLHRRSVLPLIPDHPWLDAEWRAAHGRQPLPVPGAVTLSAGWTLSIRLMAVEQLPDGWRHNPDRWQAWLDAAHCPALVLTTPTPGMRIAPLGMHGQQKQLGDEFTDRKTPPLLRQGWPLLVNHDSGVVLWVCGQTIDHHARVTAATTSVLWLRWQAAASAQFHDQ